MGNTSVLIRVQARGGKFLGPDIGYAYVRVADAGSGAILCEGMADQPADNPSQPADSGVLLDTLSGLPGPSTGGVLDYTQNPPKPWYLGVNPGQTASFLASFDLAAPTLVQITAARATPDRRPDPAAAASSLLWLEPGMQLTEDPGYVAVLPGLAVAIENSSLDGVALSVAAKVTMMCGCPIQSPAAPYWPAAEFAVTAEVWAGPALLAAAPLACAAASQFAGRVGLPGPPPPGAVLAVRAVQAAAANVGLASMALGAA